ncbi:1-acyl-sn-glycerol-3-phosphate acyltransferase [Candidatus Woesearchaeota archaeon]|nr:1-acyl-sn-glycerol-3-phosphate acyltransferase [Candidatus Woesearchaeota archaeon]
MVYPIGKIIIPAIIRPWIKEISGLENVPKKGQFIVAANHASYMDHFIIMCTLVPYLDKKIHHLAKKEHFDNIFKKAWHTYAGAIPLDRQKGGKETLRWAIKALKEGKIIAIHPEGTRSMTGKLQRAKTGVARLALISKAPVIPVGLIGTFEILPKGNLIPKAKKATMNIGKPMRFNEYHGKRITKKILREATTKIMMEIARLSKQRYNFR